MDMLNQLSNVIDWIIATVPKIVALSAMMAVFIPQSVPIVGPAIHAIALNFGRAKNE